MSDTLNYFIDGIEEQINRQFQVDHISGMELLSVSNQSNHSIVLEIFNVNGGTCKTQMFQPNQSNSIGISDLPSGLYIWSASSKNKIELSGSFVVSK